MAARMRCKCHRRVEKGSLRGKERAGQGSGLSGCALVSPHGHIQMRLTPAPREQPTPEGLLAEHRLGGRKKPLGSEQTKAICRLGLARSSPWAGAGPRSPRVRASFLPMFLFKLITSEEFWRPGTEAHVCASSSLWLSKSSKGKVLSLKGADSGPEGVRKNLRDTPTDSQILRSTSRISAMSPEC